MKQKIKAYGGLTPYGVPSLIVTGWDDDKYLHAEWFLHFESSGEPRSDSERLRTERSQWEEFSKYLKKPGTDGELLETFMDHVLKTAKGRLFGIMLNVADEKKSTYPVGIELSEETDYISTVMYLRRKFPEFIDSINTNSDELIDTIRIAKGISY